MTHRLRSLSAGRIEIAKKVAEPGDFADGGKLGILKVDDVKLERRSALNWHLGVLLSEYASLRDNKKMSTADKRERMVEIFKAIKKDEAALVQFQH